MHPTLKRLLDVPPVGMVEYLLRPRSRDPWGGPFNGQAARQQWFRELVAKVPLRAIVETGTYRGITTRFMAETSRVTVYSIELSGRHRGFSRMTLRGAEGIRLIAGDSRAELRALVDNRDLWGGPVLFYLDAHWGPALPLVEELEVIFGSRCLGIAAIDDFRVPTDDGYGFDDYGKGACLDLSLVRPVLERYGLAAFWPSAPAAAETGARRGMLVLTRDPQLTSTLADLQTLRRDDGVPST